MVSESELEELLERARGNPEADQKFFQYLLEAMVYAHVPISDDSRTLRFIQFRHPDGFDALPFFTSESKAAAAAGNTAKIVTFTGRELLEATQGATLMLNPNDGGAVLFPEEVQSLLTTGTVAQVRKDSWGAGPMWCGVPDRLPPWLIPALTRTLKQQRAVTSAYVIQTAPAANRNDVSLLIVLGVARNQAERAARACMTSIQPEAQRSPPDLTIDLTVFDPAQRLPDFIVKSGVKPFYEQESS